MSHYHLASIYFLKAHLFLWFLSFSSSSSFLFSDLFEDDFCIHLKHIFSLNQIGETEVSETGFVWGQASTL